VADIETKLIYYVSDDALATFIRAGWEVVALRSVGATGTLWAGVLSRRIPPVRPTRAHAEIGARIRHARKKAGWTQIDLATAVETCQSEISHYERGIKPLTQDVLDKIADALCIPTELLLSGETP
jgi:DNA-binding XRE family transcriptional regulator